MMLTLSHSSAGQAGGSDSVGPFLSRPAPTRPGLCALPLECRELLASGELDWKASLPWCQLLPPFACRLSIWVEHPQRDRGTLRVPRRAGTTGTHSLREIMAAKQSFCLPAEDWFRRLSNWALVRGGNGLSQLMALPSSRSCSSAGAHPSKLWLSNGGMDRCLIAFPASTTGQ